MSSPTKRAARFTRVRLENWRNFVRVEVNLARRVFLVGPNASGKSNFLDVFRFLHDVVSVGGGFQEAVRGRGGVSKLRCLAARRWPNITVEVSVGGHDTHPEWHYTLQFIQDNTRRPYIKKEIVRHGDKTLLGRPDQDDQNDAERLRQTHLEQVNVNREFRELVEFFGTVRYLHLVPQLVREPERYLGKARDPYGSDFLEQVAKTSQHIRKTRLRRINDALRVAVPQLQDLEFVRDEIRGTPHLRGRYEHWRPKAGWQNEEQFSDGTLRLLGLLWAVLDGSGPLLLEEPELSLHPDVVRFIPQMFARMQRRTGRQVLLSTYSPDMLSDEGIGLDEVLLLRPSPEGTEVDSASSLGEAKHLLEAGGTLAEVVLPHTRPRHPEQLTLFGE